MKVTRRTLFSASLGALTMGLGAVARAETEAENAADHAVFEDIFGNVINKRGLALVDWDGYIANPMVEFYVRPPRTATFPVTAYLKASNPGLYFDLPSTIGKFGPRKTIAFANANSRVRVAMSVFPDRRTDDRSYKLSAWVTDATGLHNVSVNK